MIKATTTIYEFSISATFRRQMAAICLAQGARLEKLLMDESRLTWRDFNYRDGKSGAARGVHLLKNYAAPAE
jgi:hypothetical protein